MNSLTILKRMYARKTCFHLLFRHKYQNSYSITRRSLLIKLLYIAENYHEISVYALNFESKRFLKTDSEFPKQKCFYKLSNTFMFHFFKYFFRNRIIFILLIEKPSQNICNMLITYSTLSNYKTTGIIRKTLNSMLHVRYTCKETYVSIRLHKLHQTS